MDITDHVLPKGKARVPLLPCAISPDGHDDGEAVYSRITGLHSIDIYLHRSGLPADCERTSNLREDVIKNRRV